MDRDATDTLIQDDHINVIIDSFNDERRGFQFRVNPLGVQADANFSEMEGYEGFSWDAIWDSAGKTTDWGYAIEMAIPFNQLRFPRTAEKQTWGFSAERSWPRSVRHRMQSHRRDRDSACLLCQFSKLTGFEGISPGRNLEFDPTLTAGRTDAVDMQSFPSGGLGQGTVQTDPGITAGPTRLTPRPCCFSAIRTTLWGFRGSTSYGPTAPSFLRSATPSSSDS